MLWQSWYYMSSVQQTYINKYYYQQSPLIHIYRRLQQHVSSISYSHLQGALLCKSHQGKNPCTGLERSWGFQEIPGGKVVSPMHLPHLLPRKYSWYSFLLEAEYTPYSFFSSPLDPPTAADHSYCHHPYDSYDDSCMGFCLFRPCFYSLDSPVWYNETTLTCLTTQTGKQCCAALSVTSIFSSHLLMLLTQWVLHERKFCQSWRIIFSHLQDKAGIWITAFISGW